MWDRKWSALAPTESRATKTSLGRPVEPDVPITYARSPGRKPFPAAQASALATAPTGRERRLRRTLIGEKAKGRLGRLGRRLPS